MSNHPYNSHREQQVAHRRVGTILSGSPAGAERHAHGHAFSKITSKSAAARDDEVRGRSSPKRFARGGKVHGDEAEDKKLIKKMIAAEDKKEGHARGGAVGFARGGKVGGKGKHGHQTNIAIVVPHRPGGASPPAGPMAGPAGMAPPPMAGPGLPPPGAGPGMPPPGMPPGMPMRARGGKVMAGEATPGDLKKWSKHASSNSYFRGGAATGVGREEKAAHMKGRK